MYTLYICVGESRKRRCGIVNKPVATCQNHRWVALGHEYVYIS